MMSCSPANETVGTVIGSRSDAGRRSGYCADDVSLGLPRGPGKGTGHVFEFVTEEGERMQLKLGY